MALDPSIALGVKPLQIPDPMESYGKALQLKNLLVQQQAHAQQLQLGAEQLKGIQQENQVRQQGMTDDAAARKLFAQPGGMPEDSQILSTLGPTHGGAVLKSLREADKFKVDLQESKGKVAALEADYAGSLAAGVKAAGNSPDALQIAIQHAHAAGYEQQAQQMQQLLLPENQGHIGAVMDRLIAGSPKQVELNTAARTAQARADTAANSKDRLTAELPGIVAGNTIKTNEAAGKAPIQPAQQATIDQAARTAAETKLRDAATAANQAGHLAVAQGELALGKTKNAREQQIYEQTYGAGSNEALKGVEPKLRVQATGAAQKAADEHGKAQAAAADMKTFIDLARGGNKEAYAYMAPEGVLTLNTARGVTRVNRQEMDAYAGAGSFFDQVAAKVGKLTKGQSIPSGILADIQQLHERIAGNSDDTYNAKLGAINQNYHANFQPVPKRAAPATGGLKPGDTVTVKGQKFTVGTVHPDGSWDPK